MQTSGKKTCFQFPECSLPYAKAMQASGKKTCFQFPECSLPYAKIKIKKRNYASNRVEFSPCQSFKNDSFTNISLHLANRQSVGCANFAA